MRRDIPFEILKRSGGGVDRGMDPRDWKRIRKALLEGTEVQVPGSGDEAG